MSKNNLRPRRSVLFMPASNARAVAKTCGLDVDTIILDLEDAVLPAEKTQAREALAGIFASHDFGGREVLIRINGLDSSYWQDDLAAAMATAAEGIVVPKIESATEVVTVVNEMQRSSGSGSGSGKPLWVMVETPAGVLSAQAICAADDKLCGVLIGTADLGKELHLPERSDRQGLLASLGQLVLAARAAGLCVIDGVYMDITDSEGLQLECEQGKALGFDGKSLIHPSQLAAANRVFAPTADEISKARQLVEAWQQAADSGAGVCVVNNRLVEHLHVQRAQQLIELAAAVARRSQL